MRNQRDAEEEDPKAGLRAVMSSLRQELKRRNRKLEKRRAEREEAGRWRGYREIADTLLAEPNRYPRGTHETNLVNVHSGAEQPVRLNPKLDAKGNAGLFYKKARKGERGEQAILEMVSETEREVSNVEKLVEKCVQLRDEYGEDPDTLKRELAGIRSTIESEGIIRSVGGGGVRESREEKPPYRHLQIEGYDVYIGKNDTQNDELSTRFARPADIWMHVSAHQGSHLVIRRAKGTDWPPRTVLEKAASLAAWFSKARYSSYVEVHATEARFVRKPRKAPPGTVIAERGKNIRVEPKSPREYGGQ